MSSDHKWTVYKHVLPLMRPWVAAAPEDTDAGVFRAFETHAEAIAFVDEHVRG